jgi:hypothetical protein
MDMMTMWQDDRIQQAAAQVFPSAPPVGRIIGLGATILCSAALVYNSAAGGYFSGDVQLPPQKAEVGFAQEPPQLGELQPKTLPEVIVPVTITVKASPRRQPAPRRRLAKTCRLTFTELYGSPVRICDVSRSPIRPGSERDLASLTRP